MKKILLIFLMLSSFAMAEEVVTINDVEYTLNDDVTIQVNGEMVTLEEPPYIVNNRTVVPIRFLMDILGYEVKWDGETQKVTCLRGDHTIEMTINQPEIVIDGVTYISDMVPIIINQRTYVPLAVITRGTGAEVTWDGANKLVKVEQKIEYMNLFYGKSSYTNYQSYQPIDLPIAYAWSQVMVKEGMVYLNTSSVDQNTMYIPTGYEMVMENQDKYLNIYADKNYDLIFSQKTALISDIKSLLFFPESDQPTFDGVVIDFENIPVDYYDDLVLFLKDLRIAFNETKSLQVALQPRAFDYKAISEHVDYMILMLHDYESKDDTIISLSDGYVEQPISPIQNVEADLIAAISDLSVHEKTKVLLQLNLAVVQWQGENQFQMNRYTPNYNLLLDRFEKLTEENFKYHDYYQNPYVVYQDENNRLNTIWYENEKSILARLNLVRKYNIGGISLWHLGNLPEVETDAYDMNIWNLLQEKLLMP